MEKAPATSLESDRTGAQSWPPIFPGRWLVGGLIVLLGFRFIVAWILPLHPDEAYYWTWSGHLSWSYLDHPPLVAWLIRAGTLILGPTEAGVRLGGQVAVLVTGAFLVSAGRDLVGRAETGLTAAILLLSAPLFWFTTLIMTPDVPLLLCFAGGLAAWGRLTATGRGAWWLALGAASGLGFCAKYTMVLLAPALAFWLVMSPVGRRWLKSPWPYAGLVLAVLLVMPVVAWNAGHEWVSFAWQLGHGLSGPTGSGLWSALNYLGVQAAVVTPISLVVMLAAAAMALVTGFRKRSNGALVLGLCAAVVFVFFLVSSLIGLRARGNWPAPAYLAAALAIGLFIDRRAVRVATRSGVVLALVVTLAAQVHVLWPYLPLEVRNDRAAEFRLGPQLGAALAKVIQNRPAGSRTFLVGEDHQVLAAAAFYLGKNVEARDLFDPCRYLFLPPVSEMKGGDAWLVTRHDRRHVLSLYQGGVDPKISFQTVVPRGTVKLTYQGQDRPDFKFNLYLLRNFGHPPPDSPPEKTPGRLRLKRGPSCRKSGH
jgi:4-amino-4-deoxy-L-arabinose transferase-like glycosyltransferase